MLCSSIGCFHYCRINITCSTNRCHTISYLKKRKWFLQKDSNHLLLLIKNHFLSFYVHLSFLLLTKDTNFSLCIDKSPLLFRSFIFYFCQKEQQRRCFYLNQINCGNLFNKYPKSNASLHSFLELFYKSFAV